MRSLEAGSAILGRYRIARSLGAGGMGVVYLAERIADGTEVVVKTVHDHLAHDEEMRTRFLREVEATRTLRHPHIVEVIEASADPLLLVLEYLPGRSLHETLREGPLSEADVISIAVQLLDALEVAHRSKLIHRDIKPGNVMVVDGARRGMRVKLLDFGLSRVVDEARLTKLTQTGQILGTPGYLAPEQALAQPVDARTDVYSLGMLMYRALTGRLPFDGKAAALLRAVVEDEPHPLPRLRPNVDPGLASVVHRALQKDPTFRFQSAREMRDALSPRKSRWVWIAAIAGVAAAALTIGTLALVSAQPEPVALRPVEPIVFDAQVTPTEAEAVEVAADAPTAEAPTADAPTAEAATTEVAEPEPGPHTDTAGHAPERVQRDMAIAPRTTTNGDRPRSGFTVQFPIRYRAPLQHWWRQHERRLAPCYGHLTAAETGTWNVTFDARGEVVALAVEGAPFQMTSCALHAVEHAAVAPGLHGVETSFRVTWNPR